VDFFAQEEAMSRFLMIDIGTGTMDVLYYDNENDLQYKAVVKSPAQCLAEKAARLPGNLLVTGMEMGGNPVSSILQRRAQEAEVVMTAGAAATLNHDPEKVLAWGIDIITDEEIETLKDSYTCLTLSDLDIDRIRGIVEGFGVPYSFDVLAVCAQDHGVPPAGVSHLDFRHNLFRDALEHTPFPHALLYQSDEIPPAMSRLSAIAKAARELPACEVYVMDSGMAAILGASTDIRCRSCKNILVLDVATSHTVGATLSSGEIAGFFEYHTHAVTCERIESLLRLLADGNLSHEKILREGGHGAYVRKSFGFDAAEIIIATGPKRKMLKDSCLPIVFGAPLGDNMMTGTAGLLDAVCRRKGFNSQGFVQ
jgi:uncharacterized protein (DUF1786 family)